MVARADEPFAVQTQPGSQAVTPSVHPSALATQLLRSNVGNESATILNQRATIANLEAQLAMAKKGAKSADLVPISGGAVAESGAGLMLLNLSGGFLGNMFGEVLNNLSWMKAPEITRIQPEKVGVGKVGPVLVAGGLALAMGGGIYAVVKWHDVSKLQAKLKAAQGILDADLQRVQGQRARF